VSRLRPALLAALTLVAVFVAGAATGAAFERARAPEPAAAPVAGPPPGGRPPIFAAEGPFAARLRLTAAQRDSIRAIVERDRLRADTLYREFRPRLRARFDSTTAAVESVLTEEQRAEWARIRAERHRRTRGHARPQGRRAPRGAEAPPPPGMQM
jgi:hypothetical protein